MRLDFGSLTGIARERPLHFQVGGAMLELEFLRRDPPGVGLPVDLQTGRDAHVTQGVLRSLCQLESGGARFQLGDELGLVAGEMPGQAREREVVRERRYSDIDESRRGAQAVACRALAVPVERNIVHRATEPGLGKIRLRCEPTRQGGERLQRSLLQGAMNPGAIGGCFQAEAARPGAPRVAQLQGIDLQAPAIRALREAPFAFDMIETDRRLIEHGLRGAARRELETSSVHSTAGLDEASAREVGVQRDITTARTG